MAKIEVYGASDDLIEICGNIYEEFNHSSDQPSYLAFSEGTVLQIEYTSSGIWRIVRVASGTAQFSKTEATDADDGYTDKATLEGDIMWVVFGDRIERYSAKERWD